MASFNKVILIGNLTRDPEMRYTSSGLGIVKFGLAVSRRYRTKQGEDREEVCFVDINVFGKQAENCERYLKKGSPALIEGRLQLDQWDDRETGQKRSRHTISAERVQFLSSPRNDGNSTQQGTQQSGYQQRQANPAPAFNQAPQHAAPAAHPPFPPQQAQQPVQNQAAQAPASMPPFESVENLDDDIPF